jgi:hypothetical protein
MSYPSNATYLPDLFCPAHFYILRSPRLFLFNRIGCMQDESRLKNQDPSALAVMGIPT